MKGAVISTVLMGLLLPLSMAAPAITGFEMPRKRSKELAGRQANTRNDLVNGDCKDVTVIFARGTNEDGNVGDGVGPPLFDALVALVGNDAVAVQGVDYPADIPGYLAGGSKEGAATMKGHVELAITQCPDTKIVMSGYSQGAQVTHLAGNDLSASNAGRVDAVVVFGDPYNGDAISNIPSEKIRTFCEEGDKICDGLPIVLPPHKNYHEDADEAAEFIQDKIA